MPAPEKIWTKSSSTSAETMNFLENYNSYRMDTKKGQDWYQMMSTPQLGSYNVKKINLHFIVRSYNKHIYIQN